MVFLSQKPSTGNGQVHVSVLVHVAREYVYTWVCLGNRGAFSRRQETGAGVRETDVTAQKYPAPRLE